MATTNPVKNAIKDLKAEYDRLAQGKESLLAIIDEAELSESVFNSNAIENSTLTLKETERILLEMEVSRHVSVREVFEAKNAKTMEKIVTIALTESLHKRITYLRGEKITTLADCAKKGRKSILPCLTPPVDRRFRLSVKKVFGKLELTTHERSGTDRPDFKLVGFTSLETRL